MSLLTCRVSAEVISMYILLYRLMLPVLQDHGDIFWKVADVKLECNKAVRSFETVHSSHWRCRNFGALTFSTPGLVAFEILCHWSIFISIWHRLWNCLGPREAEIFRTVVAILHCYKKTLVPFCCVTDNILVLDFWWRNSCFKARVDLSECKTCRTIGGWLDRPSPFCDCITHSCWEMRVCCA